MIIAKQLFAVFRAIYTVFLTRLFPLLIVAIALTPLVLVLWRVLPLRGTGEEMFNAVLGVVSVLSATVIAVPTHLLVIGTIGVVAGMGGWIVMWAIHYPIGPFEVLYRVMLPVQLITSLQQRFTDPAYPELSVPQRHLLADVNRTTVTLQVALAAIDETRSELLTDLPSDRRQLQNTSIASIEQQLAELSSEWHGVALLSRRLQVLRVDQIGHSPDPFLEQLHTVADERRRTLEDDLCNLNEQGTLWSGLSHSPSDVDSLIGRRSDTDALQLATPKDVRGIDLTEKLYTPWLSGDEPGQTKR